VKRPGRRRPRSSHRHEFFARDTPAMPHRHDRIRSPHGNRERCEVVQTRVAGAVLPFGRIDLPVC